MRLEMKTQVSIVKIERKTIKFAENHLHPFQKLNYSAESVSTSRPTVELPCHSWLSHLKLGISQSKSQPFLH